MYMYAKVSLSYHTHTHTHTHTLSLIQTSLPPQKYDPGKEMYIDFGLNSLLGKGVTAHLNTQKLLSPSNHLMGLRKKWIHLTHTCRWLVKG